MKREVLFLLFLLASFSYGFCQKALLETQRTFFKTNILDRNLKLSKSAASSLFQSEKSFMSSNLQRKSGVFRIAGPIIVGTGLYLGYDAIKGTRMVQIDNGVELVYYKRPLPQLIAGIFLFTAGIGVIEYSNEFTTKAVKLYNQKLIDNKKVILNAGLTSTGGFGLTGSF